MGKTSLNPVRIDSKTLEAAGNAVYIAAYGLGIALPTMAGAFDRIQPRWGKKGQILALEVHDAGLKRQNNRITDNTFVISRSKQPKQPKQI